MRLSERRARGHIARQVPDPELRRKLTPNYRLGCKRILASNTWYPAVCSENVELVSTGISEVTPRGVLDGDGVEHRVDTIIFGTGFQVTDPPISHRVIGPDGDTLAEKWQRSPKAHLGLAVSGFPNFYLLLGPNTGLGHNSVLLMIEAQVKYLTQALSWAREHGGAVLEPRAEAQSRYIAELGEATNGSVWTAGGCVSWYLDRTGRNSTLWPGSVRAYQRRVARFDPGDYSIRAPRRQPLPEPVAA
jgi:cation diffusion facilitator CzcD-associated flavoprotein CzcO